jgi:hypothetical protein
MARYGGDIQSVLCEFEPIHALTFDLTVAQAPPPVLVQVAGGFDSSALVVSAAFAAPISVNNVVAVAVGSLNLNGTTVVPTVADTLGRSYTQIGSILEADSGYGIGLFWAPPGLGGSDTVTLTLTGGSPSFTRLIIHEISNVSALGPHAIAKGAGYPLDSGAMATTAAVAFILGWGVTDNGTTTPGTGFTIAHTQNIESTEYQVVAVTGTYHATFPGDGASGSWVCAGATFS